VRSRERPPTASVFLESKRTPSDVIIAGKSFLKFETKVKRTVKRETKSTEKLSKTLDRFVARERLRSCAYFDD